jgi:hypothetical protein
MLLLTSNLYAEEYDVDDWVCEPLKSSPLDKTTGKPSDPIYIPLFKESQSRLDSLLDLTDKASQSSVENFCKIMYDCGDKYTLEDGQIEFKNCNELYEIEN